MISETTALVHDYLLVRRGAERTFLEIAREWPDSPIHTLLLDREEFAVDLARRRVHVSPLQRLRLDQRTFRYALPMFPWAARQLDLRDFSVVVSSSSAFAHSVSVDRKATHVCYCHSPFRYAYHERARALGESPRGTRALTNRVLDRVQARDHRAALRINHYVANSTITQERIRATYGLDSSVVHPPVELSRFSPDSPEDFFLVVGELVRHKRTDLVLAAAAECGVRVKVVGDGPELGRWRETYPRAEFLGRVDDPTLADLYARAIALVVPNVEEFGICSVEAQAAGRPVIGMNCGGTAETVIDGETGLLLDDMSVESLRAAFKRLDKLGLDPATAVRNAERFGPEAFRAKLRAETQYAVEKSRSAGRRCRVLSVIPGPTFGGAANQVVQLRGPLDRRGFDVIAAVPTGPGNVATRLVESGVPTVRVPMRRLRASANPLTHARLLLDVPVQIVRLRRLIRYFDIDIVQNHGDLNPYAALAGRLERRAVVWQLLDSRTPARLRPATSALIRHVADTVFVVGEALGAGYPSISALGSRVIVTPPPVDTSAIRPSRSSRDEARRRLGVSAHDLLIGTIGNRNPQKAQDVLVRAVAAVRRQTPSVDLRILGGASPDHAGYEAGLRDAIERSGLSPATVSDPGAEAAKLVHAFDIMAMTSAPYSEGMPTVLLEAMAAGIPCVSTDVGSVSEVIEHGRTGLVVAPGSDEAVVDALTHLVERPELRRQMGDAGRSAATVRFDLEACARRYHAGYREALVHRSAAHGLPEGIVGLE